MGGVDTVTHTSTLPRNQTELKTVLKPWLHLPKGWATQYHKHTASPAVYSDPTCLFQPHLGSLDFCSWEEHVWVPTPMSPGTMP